MPNGNYCNYYLDGNVIGYLCRSVDTLRLTEAFHRSGIRIFTSVVNLIETACHGRSAVRESLVNLLKAMGGNNRPLDFPGEILKRSLDAYAKRNREMNWSINEMQEGLWIALNYPENIKEREYIELSTYKEEQERWFREMHDSARATMLKTLRDDGTDLQSPMDFIVECCKHENFLEDFFIPIVQRLGFESSMRGKVKKMLHELEPWKFYFGAMAHSVYSRTLVKKQPRQAGSLDVQQAIYLAAVDIFVTDDGPLSEVMRDIAKLGNVNRRIISFEEFMDHISKLGGHTL